MLFLETGWSSPSHVPHIPEVGRVATLIHFSPLRGDGHLLHLSHSVAIPIYFSVWRTDVHLLSLKYKERLRPATSPSWERMATSCTHHRVRLSPAAFLFGGLVATSSSSTYYVLCCIIPYYHVLQCIPLYTAVLYCIMLYYIILHYMIIYCTIQYHNVQCSP